MADGAKQTMWLSTLKNMQRVLVGMMLGASILYLSNYIILDNKTNAATSILSPVRSMNFKSYRDKEPYHVIILTYMRTGSTFLGKLLAARNDTFYWYEPFWKPHRWAFYSTGQQICNYSMFGCSNVTGSAHSIQRSLEFLLDVYKCNLKGYFGRFKDSITGHRVMAGATGQVFYDCRHSYSTPQTCVQAISKDCENCTTTTTKCFQYSKRSRKGCFEEWIKRCNKSTHRATKVVRMDTSHVKYLLENHKRLKLIQLFRDPRAVLYSRQSAEWYYHNHYSLITDAKILCERMENDIQSAENLKSLFPDRVKIIQYEDFHDPNRTAKVLYNFLNMKMTEHVKSSILDPLRVNGSRFHPENFRKYVNQTFIFASNKYCQNVIQSLGLRMFNNTSDMKNKSLSAILDKLLYPLEQH